MGYLESDSISDVPFRRMAERFPENFEGVIKYFQDRHGVHSMDMEDLMGEFKPWSFRKVPGTLAILDSEIVRLAGKPDQDPPSMLSRLKKCFGK